MLIIIIFFLKLYNSLNYSNSPKILILIKIIIIIKVSQKLENNKLIKEKWII